MSPRERLSELAQERSVSLAKLSRMLGRNSTYLQQYITKKSPKKLEEEDRGKLARFFSVPESQLGAPEENSYGLARQPSSDWVEVPRLPVDAAAGSGAISDVATVSDGDFDNFRFSRRWLRENSFEPDHLSVIRVTGDSMEPLLRDGDEVMVDERVQSFRDGIHVVRLDDRLLIKRVASQGGGQYALLSQNLAYPPVTVSADEITIIGRVVWKSGRL